MWDFRLWHFLSWWSFSFFFGLCCMLSGALQLDRVLCLIISAFSEKPDPPTDLELTDQRERSVRLTWTPGNDNNSPTNCELKLIFVWWLVSNPHIRTTASNPFVPVYLSVPDPIWRFTPRAWSMAQYDQRLRNHHHIPTRSFPICVLLLQGSGT